MLTKFAGFEDADLLSLLPFAGLAIGMVFGVLAQRSRFCLRSAVVNSGATLSPMAGVYAAALLVALVGAQVLGQTGLVSLDETRFFSDSLPFGALALGGLMFGAGMVLTRGCASRLTVLTSQGNLRAGMVLLIFAITAYATLRGVLASGRAAFSEATSLDVAAGGSVPALLGVPGSVLLGFVALGLAALIWRSGARPVVLLMGAGVGLTVLAGWFATGALLFDEFDPRAAESLAFTAGASDGLFYAMASTAVGPSFAAGIIGGTLVGAFFAALFARELRLESFETPQQTLRYLAGAVLMGIGGVMAGGCTIGAGLTGVSTLALAPLVALVAIIVGAKATQLALEARGEAAATVVAAE